MSAAAVSTPRSALQDVVAGEALRGLTGSSKTLPAWLFYDERGSELFEQITDLPEYYLTRTERAIFAEYAPELPHLLRAPATVAELGAGTASKTGLLLTEFAAAQGSVLYQPVDISPSALEEAATYLAASIPGVRVEPQTANYITDRYTITRPPLHSILALYIGSSIGNFSPEEATGILRSLRGHLLPEDGLLLGVDLAPGEHKPIDLLCAAYDDAAGVTAAFNKNVLLRLNRELGMEFQLEQFAHEARWNAAASRMEMHLRSLTRQTVHLDGETIVFEAGETIHTENSYKFTEAAIDTLLSGSGFAVDRTLLDAAKRFAVVLAKAV